MTHITIYNLVIIHTTINNLVMIHITINNLNKIQLTSNDDRCLLAFAKKRDFEDRPGSRSVLWWSVLLGGGLGNFWAIFQFQN